jgi:hypothetical protein
MSWRDRGTERVVSAAELNHQDDAQEGRIRQNVLCVVRNTHGWRIIFFSFTRQESKMEEQSFRR